MHNLLLHLVSHILVDINVTNAKIFHHLGVLWHLGGLYNPHHTLISSVPSALWCLDGLC